MNNPIAYTFSGDDLPAVKHDHEMVSSADKKSLYAIGGYSTDGSGYSNKVIYKYQCPGAINTCKWKKIDTELKYGRYRFVAIPIPNSLADKLCK